MSKNKSGATSRPALYNPTAACVLALLFTPIFGALLQARNWDALGEHGRARASRMWVRTTLWLLFIFVIMQAVFQNEPFMQFGGLYFLVVTWASWMVTTGWKQIGYVHELFGNDYPRERLGRVTIFAGGCWVIYSMVSISIAMAIQLTGLDKMLPGAERVESQGVVLRVPEGSDKVVVEPLPIETKKAE